MARIPTADQIGRPGIAGGRGVISRGDVTSIERAQLGSAQMVGQSERDLFGRIDAEAVRYAEEEKKKLDQDAFLSAKNKLDQKTLDLTIGDNGYSKVSGEKAIDPNSPLIQTYSDQRKTAAEDIGKGLSPEIKRRFDLYSQESGLQFQAGILNHQSKQAAVRESEVEQGSIALAKQQAGSLYNDPIAILSAKANIDEVFSAAQSKGRAPELVQAQRAEKLSEINEAVLTGAISNGEYDYAEKYLRNNSQEMLPATAARFNGLLNTYKKQNLAISIGDDAVRSATKPVTETRSAFDIAVNTESGGKQFDASGKPLTSSKGAIGIAQVMPSTGPEAAKLAGLPWNEEKFKTDPEYNKAIGQAYFDKQVQDFGGDVQKAWAAYNAGPGALRSAIQKAGPNGDWLSQMPEETQAYVTRNSAAYQKGGFEKEPSLADVLDRVEKDPRLVGQDPEVVQAAKQKAKAAFNEDRAIKSQQQDDLLGQVMDQVDSGKVKSIADLSPSLLHQLGPKRTSAISYVNGAQDRQDKINETSPASLTQYYGLVTTPQRLREMSVSDVMSLTPELGQQRVKSLLDKRASYINNPEKELSATIDGDQFKDRAVKFGFDLSNKDQKIELISIRDRVETTIDALQKGGKQLTREEKGQIIDAAMVPVTVKAIRSGGIFSGSSTIMETRGYNVKNAENIIVPDDDKSKIISAYNASGINPTPAQIRAAYLGKITKGQK